MLTVRGLFPVFDGYPVHDLSYTVRYIACIRKRPGRRSLVSSSREQRFLTVLRYNARPYTHIYITSSTLQGDRGLEELSYSHFFFCVHSRCANTAPRHITIETLTTLKCVSLTR